MTTVDCVTQRSAANAAQAKLKHVHNKSRLSSASSSASSSSSTSSSISSPTLSDATHGSSADSGSAFKSSSRKPACKAHANPPRAAALDPFWPPALSDASTGNEEAVQPDKTVDRRQQEKKRVFLASSEPGVSKPIDLAAAAETSSASMRSTSKRSAARAAQNNIQRSYSDLALAELTEPVQKKLRSSTPSRSSTSARTKPDRQDHNPCHAPSSPVKRTSKPSSKGAPVSPALRNGQRFPDRQGIVWELQLARCSSAAYSRWRKCVACVSKKAGDTCRFLEFRAFAVDPSADEIYTADVTSAPFPVFISSPELDQVMDLPSIRKLHASALSEAQTSVAKSLLPVLEAELQHAHHINILRRPRETTCRQMCEFCATSIFSASWFCQRCGREYCPDCREAIEHPDDSDALLAKRIVQCDRDRGHRIDDLIPLTRFDAALLEQEVTVMRAMLASDIKQKSGSSGNLADLVSATVSSSSGSDSDSSSNKDDEKSDKWRDIPEHRVGLEADRIVGSLPLRSFEADSFDNDAFRREWAHGEPLLVRNVTVPMQQSWGPDTLADRYGVEMCSIIRSDTDPPVVEHVSVGDFFSTFGQDRSAKEQALGTGSWKLKDWPPSAEFKHEFPELYQDFNRAVPAPDYTTREGILNLGSCYPAGVIQPDLGPKMYNAWPSSEGVEGHGTTRLHMDMADAVNIMLYAAPPTGDDVPDEHRPGVAAWDIFRAEDADMLRAFLREEHAQLHLKDDPIHIQRFFITAPQRVKLYRKCGIKSWRIYQKAGEAVLIPAGCAHQVCNLTDCVKVAVDFVSPQNVERCFKLTAEFRELVKDYKKAWKEDVLSLRTTLWYAWCTYREMDHKGPNVWAKVGAEKADEAGNWITKKIQQSA